MLVDVCIVLSIEYSIMIVFVGEGVGHVWELGESVVSNQKNVGG